MWHGKPSRNGPLTVTFITPENEKIVCKAKEGQHLLEIAHANDVELEGMHPYHQFLYDGI